jgi:Ni2+-binding GTPase involved in maturation of urease and hydrogenase
MNRIKLVLVGGFLGAGKTTLLREAAGRLVALGNRVGLITNDQAPDLVDTGVLAARGYPVSEVTGSCFCCNFPGLIAAAEGLGGDLDADVLIAEPVGSCTDLSATILQPLKDKYADRFDPGPFTVLADALRLRDLLSRANGALHPSARYIYRKQLEEADIIAVNKTDLLGPGEIDALLAQAALEFPGAELLSLSAVDGSGVDRWLDTALSGKPGGRRIASVDYDTYAEGEAVLGWLNAAIRLEDLRGGADWREYCAGLLESLRKEIAGRRAEVAHVKAFLSADGGSCFANLTRTDGQVSLQGGPLGSTRQATLILNARVEMAPRDLEDIVRAAIAATSGTRIASRIEELRSFSPGRPSPTYRYPEIVVLPPRR